MPATEVGLAIAEEGAEERTPDSSLSDWEGLQLMPQAPCTQDIVMGLNHGEAQEAP